MVFRSVAAAGVIRTSVVAGCVAILAGCSTVTYGTGTPTGTQTLRDITGVLDFSRGNDGVNYEDRDGIETPPTADLPPPQEAEPTSSTPPVVVANPNECAIAPGQVSPPAEYCLPNPNAPQVVAQDGGLFGDAGTNGIRKPTDPCAWWSLDWSQMSTDEQDAWSALGWSAANWGTFDPALRPASASAGWSDLSFAERRAARQLGFDDDSWGFCLI